MLIKFYNQMIVQPSLNSSGSHELQNETTAKYDDRDALKQNCRICLIEGHSTDHGLGSDCCMVKNERVSVADCQHYMVGSIKAVCFMVVNNTTMTLSTTLMTKTRDEAHGHVGTAF
jgi:hypothetical protein